MEEIPVQVSPYKDVVPVATILKGRWSKADLLLVEADHRKAVLKDFSRKIFLTRIIGRVQIRREEMAYRALQHIEGIPRFLKRPDPYSIVIEYVDGTRLTHYGGSVPFRQLVRGLKEIIQSIHEAGVVHNDIRGRENIVVRRSDDKLMLLDFAGAVIFTPGSMLHRLFFNMFRKIDEAAYLKWKSILTPEDMSDDERRFLRRFNALRKFWIFNRKGK